MCFLYKSHASFQSFHLGESRKTISYVYIHVICLQTNLLTFFLLVKNKHNLSLNILKRKFKKPRLYFIGTLLSSSFFILIKMSTRTVRLTVIAADGLIKKDLFFKLPDPFGTIYIQTKITNKLITCISCCYCRWRTNTYDYSNEEDT